MVKKQNKGGLAMSQGFFGSAKAILQDTANGKKEKVDRRKGGKTISKSEQGWTLPDQLGQLRTGQDRKGLL